MNPIDELERLLAEQGLGTLAVTKTRADGTAQVYATSRGPCRVVVPVCETMAEFAPLIAGTINALPDLLRGRRELKARVLTELAIQIEDENLVDYDLAMAWSDKRESFAYDRAGRLLRHWGMAIREGRIA